VYYACKSHHKTSHKKAENVDLEKEMKNLSRIREQIAFAQIKKEVKTYKCMCKFLKIGSCMSHLCEYATWYANGSTTLSNTRFVRFLRFSRFVSQKGNG
jgi:hypothetical protein